MFDHPHIQRSRPKALRLGAAALALALGLSLSGTALLAQEAIWAQNPAIDAAMPDPEVVAEEQQLGNGMASYYSNAFAGRPTASGERFDPAQLTAAHRSLPFGSKVRVTHLGSGQSVVVRINDRGPFHGNRVIDVSSAAARQLSLIGPGTGRVTLALLP